MHLKVQRIRQRNRNYLCNTNFTKVRWPRREVKSGWSYSTSHWLILAEKLWIEIFNYLRNFDMNMNAIFSGWYFNLNAVVYACALQTCDKNPGIFLTSLFLHYSHFVLKECRRCDLILTTKANGIFMCTWEYHWKYQWIIVLLPWTCNINAWHDINKSMWLCCLFLFLFVFIPLSQSFISLSTNSTKVFFYILI